MLLVLFSVQINVTMPMLDIIKDVHNPFSTRHTSEHRQASLRLLGYNYLMLDRPFDFGSKKSEKKDENIRNILHIPTLVIPLLFSGLWRLNGNIVRKKHG